MVKMTRYRKRYINWGKRPSFTKNPYQMRYAKPGFDMALQKAGQALGVANSVRALFNTEFKVKDTAGSGGVSNAGTLVLLNGLSKGNTISTRVARSILVKSVELNAQVLINASTTVGSAWRILLFIDKNPDGSAPTVGDVITSSAANFTLDFRELDNRKRFIILKDWKGVVNQNNQELKVVCNSYYKRLQMHTIYDDSDAGTIADIQNNALYLLLVSNEATNTPTVTYNARIRYLDN